MKCLKTPLLWQTLGAAMALALLGWTTACSTDKTPHTPYSAVAPQGQPKAAAVNLHPELVSAMYRQLVAIDLSSVVHLARLSNLDIQQARQQVEVERGRFASAVGGAFPVLAPTAIFLYNNGAARSTAGNIVTADFRALTPAAAIQWVINPGRTIFNIVASRERFSAARQQQRSVLMQTLTTGAIQYYQLVLRQADVAAAHESTLEQQELLRIAQLRFKAGAAIAADVASARAAYASSQRDLLLALNAFYRASVDLSLTLRLDPTLTLVPRARHIFVHRLISDRLTARQMIVLAIKNRPDLQSLRDLLRAAAADKGAVGWGDLGPTLAAGYAVGATTSNAGVPSNGSDFSNYHYRGFQQGSLGGGWTLGLSTFGDIHTAGAKEQIARIQAERLLDQVQAQVVDAQQESITNAKLIPIVTEQLESADYALHTIQENFRAGTNTEFDVLVAEAALAKARRDYAQAIVRYNQSQIALLASLGMMDHRAVTNLVQTETQINVSAPTSWRHGVKVAPAAPVQPGKHP
ncbi:MAG: TolC family protein [Phycisphaerae bacterium]